jgi:hypothetical protein
LQINFIFIIKNIYKCIFHDDANFVPINAAPCTLQALNLSGIAQANPQKDKVSEASMGSGM